MPLDRHVHEIEQKEVPGYPGWRFVVGKNVEGKTVKVHYTSPLGEEWTRAKFNDAVDSGEIRKTTETDPTAEVARREAERQQYQFAAQTTQDDNVKWEKVDLPETSARRLPKSSPELASSSDIALTATLMLLIMAHIIATFSRVPEAAMSKEEAQGLAVPIGNIFASSSLNKKYGRYLRDSSDYVALGYSLYAYVSRVGIQVRDRREAESRAEAYGQRPTNVSGITSGYRTATTGSVETGAKSTKPRSSAGSSASGASGQSGVNPTLPASGGIAAQTAGIVGINPIPKQNSQ